MREVSQWPGVVDVVVAREDVAIYFDAPPVLDVAAHIARLRSAPDDDVAGREHVIRVVYDGADLEDVARGADLTIEEVIERHAAAIYSVALMGFAPGFAYLDGLDPRIATARHETPRPRVEAGSLAIGGNQTAIYPFAGPGGWNLIGRVLDTKMFDECGPLLALGDRVRFVR